MLDYDRDPITVTSWDKFTQVLSGHRRSWLYRGQFEDWPLQTSLERALYNWSINPQEAPDIERQMVRDFRRRYRGDDHALAQNDTLYCLALMQHYGAPTRLLDWTYSPFVAARFALSGVTKKGVVWCLNDVWCATAAARIVSERLYEERYKNRVRDDSTFLPIYCEDANRKRFAYPENAMQLNERLIVQQGVFLCVGDITAPAMDNLKAMNGWDLSQNIVRVKLELDGDETYRFARMLTRMNVSSDALFPGPDGFSRSLGERLFIYRDHKG